MPSARAAAISRRVPAVFAGLAVIVDFHPEEPYKKAVEKCDVAVANLVGMWRALARHLSSRDPEKSCCLRAVCLSFHDSYIP